MINTFNKLTETTVAQTVEHHEFNNESDSQDMHGEKKYNLNAVQVFVCFSMLTTTKY